MGLLHNDTITVFTMYENDTATWYPTVISGVNLQVDRAARQAKTGLENADAAMVNIPCRKVNGKVIIDGKTYLRPKEWVNQTNDMLPETVTFIDGNSFIIRGDYGSDNLVNDDDYRDGFRQYVEKYFDDTFLVTSVADYSDSIIPHLEVSGK